MEQVAIYNAPQSQHRYQDSQQHTPNSRQIVLAEITKLLTFFFIPGLDPSLEEAMALDWASDLSRFDAGAVKDACSEWRRTKTRRPTVAEMMVLCTDYERALIRSERIAIEGPYQPSRREYGEGHTDTVPRVQMKAWWQAWKENFPAPAGMLLDDWKEIIRTRAKEICPECTWQMPGE